MAGHGGRQGAHSECRAIERQKVEREQDTLASSAFCTISYSEEVLGYGLRRRPLPKNVRDASRLDDRAELIADAVMHVTGIAFAVVGLIWLIDEADNLAGFQKTAVWIYGGGLVTMLAMSAAYNMWPISPECS